MDTPDRQEILAGHLLPATPKAFFPDSRMSAFFPQECYSCYTVLSDPPGVFVCLDCPTPEGFCETHALEHFQLTKHTTIVLTTVTGRYSFVLPTDDGRFVNDSSSDFSIDEIAFEFRTYPERVFTLTSEILRRPLIAGFFNLGNTCYYNSNLHVLLSISEFTDYCLTESCKNSHKIGFELHRFVGELVNGHHQTLINGRLRLAIDADEPEFLKPDPVDSVLFFHYIFRTIRRYVPQAPLSLSEFDVLTEAKCSNCGETIPIGTDKSVYVLPIEPAVVTWEEIRDSLPAMIGRWARFARTDWDCPKCHGRGGEFTRKITKAPKYLFINNQLDYGESDEERFKRNLVLELDPQALRIGCVEGETDVGYRLRSFMHHVGRWAKYGHDISFVRYGDEWIKFNDHRVVPVPNLQSEVVFGQQYLYLWERVN